MLVDPDKYPSFCKLLFRQGFMDKILMPPVFIKENKKKLAKTCLLKTDIAAGMSWEAKIVKENSHFFICDGEWPKFVAHHKLKLGDILLFFLVDKSTFHILPYGQKTCKNLCRRQLFEELSSSSEEEEECDVGIRLSRKSKKVKTEPKELPGVAEEEEAQNRSKENGPKTLRYSVVNLKNKNPYYEMAVRKTHSLFVTIPMTFARWSGIIKMKKITLINGEGKKWKVDIEHIGPRVLIKGGWAAFRTQNKIAANGETCRFKLIQGRRRGRGRSCYVLQVEKISKP
ncbi:B3 domain-containing protein REM9-like isoform X1 [Nicotiana sylvestris]|uniref:B3 domain-containing protein At5g66980 isoform X1 n=1 Tax=Nicotiana sylvestris TaxID=4096 RepID=A0A1U7X1S5_NICSY|nr:PREDICTED: putative B3 domain-containing protein At5g66980 isoform X1 [Nicotiana sylvestris]